VGNSQSATKGNQRHVVQHPEGGWAVKKPNSARASSRHSTQSQAEDRAKEILSHSGGGEAVIHARNGQIRESDTVGPATADWSLLSPHGRILFFIAICPGSMVRDIAKAVGQTERAVWGTVKSLMRSGMLRMHKKQRRNHYAVNLDAPLLHPTIEGLTLRPVLKGVIREARADADEICVNAEKMADAPA
jgi:uncharacterized protein DUF2188